MDETNIPYFLVGHVGDGNFHFGYLINPDNEEEKLNAERLNKRLIARAIRLQGTCTGEHGIEMHKIHVLEGELGKETVGLMKKIKQALDPKNIFNPGKVVQL